MEGIGATEEVGVGESVDGGAVTKEVMVDTALEVPTLVEEMVLVTVVLS